ncbi:MAG: serine/threonine-protein kinase [Planctomycetota bacterium]
MADPRDVSDSGRNPPPPPPPPPPGRKHPAPPKGSGFGQRSPYAPGQDPYASGRRSVESSGLRRQPSTLDHSAASGVRPMDASALRRPDGSGVRRPDGSGVRRPDAPVHGSQLGVSSPLAGYVDREGPTFIDRSERGPVNRDDPTWRSNQGLGSSQGVAPLGQLVSSGAPTPRVSTESLDRLADTLGAPRSSGLIGRTIDDFRIVRLIAQGGMGAVYEAVDDQLKRRVALKTLLGGSRAEKSEVDRFVREAHAVSQLAHPNLVGIYRAGARDGVLYIAMELVQGETLHQLIRRSGFLEPHHAAEIIAAAASGLSHAHEHGILHRDMKPANVIVTPKGEVKVTDFGVAKVAGGESLTQSGIALGTPSYMSPEQALGYNDRLDERSDVYGLGAVLYECLTGRPPFHQSSQLATMEAVISEEVPAIELVRPGLDPQLIAVCKRCLEKEPGKRYASCEQLERDLQAWLQGRTVSAQAPHALRTLARRARPLAPVIPAALVLLLFLGYLLPRRAALRLGEAADDAEALLLERTAALEAALAPSGDPAALDELSALDLAASTRAELLGEAPSAERAAAVERGLARVDPARLQALRAPEAAARARGLSPDASDAATRAAWSRVAELDPLSEVGRRGRLLLAQAALERDPAAERELERLAQTSDALGQRARGLLLGRLVAHREFGRAARVCDDPHVRSFLEGVGGRWRSGLPATLCPFNQEQGAVGLLALGEDGSTWWGGLGGPLAFRWNLPQGSIGLGVGGTTGLLLYVQRGSTFVVPVADGLSHWSGAGFAVANHEVVHADYDGQTLVLSSEQGVLEITLSSLARSVLSQSGSCPVARLHGAAGGRTVWLDGRQLYDGRGALDASPCDALAPAWLGGTTRGALAWAREPNGDDPRRSTCWPPKAASSAGTSPRARELLAWTTVLDDRPLLVRHYRSEAGYRLEWIALDGLAAPSTALGLDLPRLPSSAPRSPSTSTRTARRSGSSRERCGARASPTRAAASAPGLAPRSGADRGVPGAPPRGLQPGAEPGRPRAARGRGGLGSGPRRSGRRSGRARRPPRVGAGAARRAPRAGLRRGRGAARVRRRGRRRRGGRGRRARGPDLDGARAVGGRARGLRRARGRTAARAVGGLARALGHEPAGRLPRRRRDPGAAQRRRAQLRGLAPGRRGRGQQPGPRSGAAPRRRRGRGLPGGSLRRVAPAVWPALGPSAGADPARARGRGRALPPEPPHGLRARAPALRAAAGPPRRAPLQRDPQRRAR